MARPLNSSMLDYSNAGLFNLVKIAFNDFIGVLGTQYRQQARSMVSKARAVCSNVYPDVLAKTWYIGKYWRKTNNKQ